MARGTALAKKTARAERGPSFAETRQPFAADVFFDAAATSRLSYRNGARHEPSDISRELVRIWSEVGTEPRIIATELGLDLRTLEKHYAEELLGGEERGVARVAQSLYAKALRGDTAAMIFYLKAKGRRVGWIDKEDDKPAGGASQLDVVNAVLQTVQALKGAAQGLAPIAMQPARVPAPSAALPAAAQTIAQPRADDWSDVL